MQSTCGMRSRTLRSLLYGKRRLLPKDKDTRAVFGDYVDVYDIEQAVKDGATVPIFYESRLVKLELDSAVTEAVDEEVEELTEGEEEATRARTKSRWAALEKLVGTAPRIETIAADLVKHFETRPGRDPR